jgi:hypothetical protein
MGIEAGFGETVGFLSPWSSAFFANAWVRNRAASFGVGVFAMPPDRVDVIGTGTVVLRLVTSTLHACGRIAGKNTGFHVSLCGQSFVGAVHGRGEGFAINREGIRPWFALGGMGLLEGPLMGRWGWSLRASLAVPLISQRFTATLYESSSVTVRETRMTLFEPEMLAGFLGVGIRYTIF